jgi:RNA polymerase sigma factor (sigma-70 family)
MDHTSFGTLNSRYADALTVAQRLARGMYGGWSPERRDDLVQTVMQNLWRHFADQGWPENLEAYLRTAVRNTARNLVASTGRSLSAPAGLGEAFEDVGSFAVEGWLNELRMTPSMRALRKLVLEELLSLLSASDASLLRLRFVDNLPTRMVAQTLGIHPDSVSRAVARAIGRLRVALADHPEIVAAL